MRKDKALDYLRFAQDFANRFSKDLSTKVGALFLHPTDFTILASGYNGFPRGANDDLPARHERPLKYEYAEHAERNGIFNQMRPKLRDSLVLTTEVPTMSTARAVISVGATSLWVPAHAQQSTSFNRVHELLLECGASLHLYQGDDFFGEAGTKLGRKLPGFLQHAYSLATHLAKTPDAGATLFLDPETFTVKASGYSGMPRGADDSRIERYSGEERTFWVEDSVRNAIYNEALPLLRGSVAIATAVPCSECARGIAAVGSRSVVSILPAPEFRARWDEHIERSNRIFDELGIELQLYSAEEVAGN